VRQFDWGARKDRPAVERDRVLTVPNAISLLRLLGLPVFVWLMIGPQAYGKAFAVLVLIASTDWVDGYVARRFDQVSRLGRVLDPLIDRAMLATTGVTLVVVGFLPWAVLAAVVVRDVLLLAGAAVVFRGVPDIPVSRLGKFATACLLIGLPGFLVGNMDWAGARPLLLGAWGITLVGIAGYWVAGLRYGRAVLHARSEAAALQQQTEASDVTPRGRATDG
jgi:cardiolipin synthase (CMP-forming)